MAHKVWACKNVARRLRGTFFETHFKGGVLWTALLSMALHFSECSDLRSTLLSVRDQALICPIVRAIHSIIIPHRSPHLISFHSL